jgi:hypothetical protein
MKEGAMANELPRKAIRDIWQNQAVEHNKMSVDEIRTKARDYQKRIRRRNLREYMGVAIVIAGFGWFAWQAPSLSARVGHLLIVAGALYIAFQLHQAGSSKTVPADLGLMDGIAFHRAELQRQLRVYRQAWLWVLTLVPGLTVLMAGATGAKPRVPLPGGVYGPPLAILCGWFLVILWLRKRNRKKAGEIQRQLDRLTQAESQA